MVAREFTIPRESKKMIPQMDLFGVCIQIPTRQKDLSSSIGAMGARHVFQHCNLLMAISGTYEQRWTCHCTRFGPSRPRRAGCDDVCHRFMFHPRVPIHERGSHCVFDLCVCADTYMFYTHPCTIFFTRLRGQCVYAYPCPNMCFSSICVQ